MHICLIMDNPETLRHPVIGMALQELQTNHTIDLFDVLGLSSQQAVQALQQHPAADLYLLKSHAPGALAAAYSLEQQGRRVVNSWRSSLACQDRVLMSTRMHDAHLPWPTTQYFPSLAHLLVQPTSLAHLTFPLIVKSHYSHRGDLVAKIESLTQLQALALRWSAEPIVLQEYAESDGWDIKLWIIDRQVFAAHRRTPLEAGAAKEDILLTDEELPPEWSTIALDIGRVFNLRLYGVDLLLTQQGPIIVDVNAFPGFRGVHGAVPALVTLVQNLLAERQVAV